MYNFPYIILNSLLFFLSFLSKPIVYLELGRKSIMEYNTRQLLKLISFFLKKKSIYYIKPPPQEFTR